MARTTTTKTVTNTRTAKNTIYAAGVKDVNKKWLVKEATRANLSYGKTVDALIDAARKGNITIKPAAAAARR